MNSGSKSVLSRNDANKGSVNLAVKDNQNTDELNKRLQMTFKSFFLNFHVKLCLLCRDWAALICRISERQAFIANVIL